MANLSFFAKMNKWAEHKQLRTGDMSDNTRWHAIGCHVP